MPLKDRRRYALADYAVEHRSDGWYFGRQLGPREKYLGPYASVASVTLMIAKHLKKEVERRDIHHPAD
jgi:hypothetical protein